MPVPVIAIVGRPNVGKSTLFNRLIRQKKAIIDDIPGVTRDRNYGTFVWNDRGFLLIDTGGLDTETEHPIYTKVHEQALIAIEEADLIIFLMDGKEGIVPQDKEMYLELHKSNKPLLCAVNKADNQKITASLSDFFSLGIEKFYPISAIHGTGIEDLMEEALTCLPVRQSLKEEQDLIRLAIIGRPNVGKSSLLNKILREDRSLVSEIPGTTRDCIDTPFKYNYRSYLLVDTAGIRRQKSIKDELEKVTILKTIKNIENCHVALFIIDALQGITEQDVRIGGIAHEAGKGIVIVVNKWDAVRMDEKTMKKYEEEVLRDRLKFLYHAPMIFVSALTGQRVYKIFPLVEKVMDQYSKRITTGILNRAVMESLAESPPPLYQGKRVKFYYQTQVSIMPPTFTFFVNYPKGIHFSYKRYLQNQIRERLGLDATPLHFIFRSKDGHPRR